MMEDALFLLAWIQGHDDMMIKDGNWESRNDGGRFVFISLDLRFNVKKAMLGLRISYKINRKELEGVPPVVSKWSWDTVRVLVHLVHEFRLLVCVVKGVLAPLPKKGSGVMRVNFSCG
uniref:Uncharacterized protein n=1 Tax=Tanacetum cinerariifolium TaxID=118510 RepID=A0A6L2M2B0_TANCI|nr:hypothetical protein [Tanacetum cinerariifolium]